MSNKIISNKYALLTATILSALMVVTSAVPSLLPTMALAQASDLEVDPTTQTDAETDLNINVDPDVIFSEDCEDIDAADETEQVIEQPVKQEDNNNNEVDDGGLVVEPTTQTAALTGLNINVDTDVFVVWQCEDGSVEIDSSDETEQVTDQPVEQQTSGSEVGEDSEVIGPDTQTTQVTGLNYNLDNEYLVALPS